jgi:translation initiation factor 2B subunit (eIF-2B alpha/beta/delta family)
LKLAENDNVNLHIKVVDGGVDGSGRLKISLSYSYRLLAKKLIKKLIERGVQCTYGLLNCLATELPHTHLVLLGATAACSNGSLVVARGSASVAHLAQSFNVPVLVAVNSYQFVDKVGVKLLNIFPHITKSTHGAE